MEKLTLIEQKVNQVATEFGFREFLFTAEKAETAQRALSRFVKAMNNRIVRDEIENKSEIKLKLDLISNLIKKVNNAKFTAQSTEKVEFVLESTADQMFDYHKNRLVKYFSNKLAKELKFNYTVLKNYYAFATYAQQKEGAKESLEELRTANKDIFAKIKELESTTLDNLEASLLIRNELNSKHSNLFNTNLMEEAITVSKLNKEKIDEINKTYLSPKPKQFNKKKTAKAGPKRKIDMSKVKTNTTKEAYTDKGAENNPFAALLGEVKK